MDLDTGVGAPPDDKEVARAVWRALGTVIDPELGLDIVTLGLVYGVVVDGGVAYVTHTLTTRGCPMGRAIADGIRGIVQLVEGVSAVEPLLVWDPPWSPAMIAPDAWGTAPPSARLGQVGGA